ncbi:hypothetical protein T440DRAFT_488562 [Plenodomus tracheiphilus IPT5]|uniref:Aminoglycoside phosphotransferase domain-containing protein n=1 Tax=Plenodomus tracheiphilus IPT5 TaxID=1408161 RepID=A0A6A7BC02_9PLEO|nr:hypothetical protein T440DRAFT_488562 [Plenodomus tracheiphilus IPT5]
MTNQEGLEWVSTTFGLEPRWTAEPDIDAIAQIARKHLDRGRDVPINVSFHAQGAFNKLYRISTGDSDHLLRVSLPVYPRMKTESEVATIEFIRNNTVMPVPRILAYDADNKNELQYEWILIEMMPGTPLNSRWRSMSWQAKETIIKQLAAFQAQLFTREFSRIGNLFHNSIDLGPLVSLIFFWGDHLQHEVPRGPFLNSHEWLRTRLSFALLDQQCILRTSEVEDDLEDAEFAKALIEDILEILPNIFPTSLMDGSRSILFHDDLSILTAIIDWDSDAEDDDATSCNSPDSDGVSSLYWDHLLEFEQTQLRKVFVEEMTMLQPEWVMVMKESTLKADFEKVVHNCDNSWAFRAVRRWITISAEGRIERLADELIR